MGLSGRCISIAPEHRASGEKAVDIQHVVSYGAAAFLAKRKGILAIVGACHACFDCFCPPSFRPGAFFASVGPSPRIQYAVVGDDGVERWTEWRTRPLSAPPHHMVARLFWNWRWNDTLFAVSRVERFLEGEGDEHVQALIRRVRADLNGAVEAGDLRIRVVLVQRNGDRLVSEEAWRSDALCVEEGAAA